MLARWPTIPPTALRVAKAGLLLGLVILLWWSVDWRASIELGLTANLWLLGAAALVLTVQTILSAFRWRLTARQLGIEISPLAAIREYYLGQLVNQSLPGGVIGDANRALRVRAQAGLAASAQAVVFERLSGQLGLLAILAAGLGIGLLVPGGIDWPAWSVVTLLLGLCALAAGLLVSNQSGRRNGGETRLRRFARSFAHAVAGPDVLWRQIALSLGTASCNIAAFALCAAALGVTLPLLTLVVLVPAILFAMVLPLSVSGWGLREGAAAALFPTVGATASEGLATSVVFGLVFLATVLPGLLVTWLRPNTPVPAPEGATFDP